MQKKQLARNCAKAYLSDQKITTENSDLARLLSQQGGYGKQMDDGRVQLSFLEAVYLAEKGKLAVYDMKGKEIATEKLVQKAKRHEKSFSGKYAVFKDIRNRGYIIKTALKFGADFRIYDRGIKPGEDHARWILYPVREGSTMTWHDFASKNRVAHSTKKRLLIGILDDEDDVTYYEVRWVKP